MKKHKPLNVNNKRYICFVDFETTGSNPFCDYPIQIGAVLTYEDLTVIQQYSSYIKPPKSIQNTYAAYSIHNIDLSKIQNESSADYVLDDFFNTLGTNFCFASWNINFDVSFFHKICYVYDKMYLFNNIDYRHIDIQSICRLARTLGSLNSNIKSLNDCVRHFNLDRSHNHDAFEDALLSLYVYKNLLSIFI